MGSGPNFAKGCPHYSDTVVWQSNKYCLNRDYELVCCAPRRNLLRTSTRTLPVRMATSTAVKSAAMHIEGDYNEQTGAIGTRSYSSNMGLPRHRSLHFTSLRQVNALLAEFPQKS